MRWWLLTTVAGTYEKALAWYERTNERASE
jgi:hypothetical protein